VSLCFGAIFVGGETLEVRDRPIVGDGLGCLGLRRHTRLMEIAGSCRMGSQAPMVSKSPKDWVGGPRNQMADIYGL